MIIQHNMLANFTQRELKISTGQKAKSTEKLSSGYRINRSADDAAGLTISESMRWNIRGLDKASKNCQDGASMMQVADGALTEVHAMLDRMKELSVQAANDTNTQEDRQAIQREMNQLVQEIDRIGDTTEFNTRKLFQGSEVDVIDQNTGRRINASDIPISDFSVGDVELIGEPFKEYPDDPQRTNSELNLGVVLKGNYNVTGKKYPLIYQGGSYAGCTSKTTFYYSYISSNDQRKMETVDLEMLSPAKITKNSDSSYTRTFEFESEKNAGVKFEIKQNVNIGSNDGTKQEYTISYDIHNLSTVDDIVDGEIKTGILMSVDTSYGGTHRGDLDESYFSNGSEVDKFDMYLDLGGADSARSFLGKTSSKFQGHLHKHWGEFFADDAPIRSFSIFNMKNPELPFSEYVNVGNANLLAFGAWGTNENTLEGLANGGGNMFQNTNGRDKSFTALWTSQVAIGDISHIDALEIGIKKKTEDHNLDGFDVSGKTGKIHSEKLDLWIQSGSTEKSGFFVSIGEMNSDVLGLRKLDVSSYAAASDANDRVDKAIQKISGQRTLIGVQQNRMEYASKIDDNTSENTQYAESRIRDTDMAKEMVNYSKHNIVEQMGQNMLAQANQSTQGVMSLLG